MVVDVHCHVGQVRRPRVSAAPFAFERGPWEAFISLPLFCKIPAPLRRWMLGTDLVDGFDAVNQAVESFLLRHILGATSVDRSVILAFDAYHTDEGRALGPAKSLAARGTHLYMSNTYVRDLCARHPGRLWFGASVHPYRADALDALDAVARAGAKLIKWLPLAQNIRADDPRTRAFLSHAGRIGVPLLIHYGGEMALPNPLAALEDPAPMLDVLDDVRRDGPMPPVIVAHFATPSLPWTRTHHVETMAAAMRTRFRDSPLYADLAGLATWNRAGRLKWLLKQRDLHEHLVYGSDFPVPTFPIFFRRQLGAALGAVARCRSWVERDFQLKRNLGFPPMVFTRMGALLDKRERSQPFDMACSLA